MATQFHLTDPDMAVYRPWVWIKFANVDFAINHPAGVDQRFRWLKDFRWSINIGNQGSSVEFTIYENRAGWNFVWPGVALSDIGETEGKMMTCQWGWSGRGDEVGKEAIGPSASGVGGTVESFMRDKNTSGVHSMVITKLDVEYAEGGINYRFTASDPFALGQYKTGHGANKDETFKQAVQNLLTKMEKSGSLPTGYAFRSINQGFTADFTSEFDTRQTGRWPENGFPLLMTIQKWTSHLRPRRNEGRKDAQKVVPLIVPDTTAGQEKLVFTTSYIKGSNSLFEIHVNPPEQGPLGTGKHTAINLRPQFAGDIQWAFYPQTNRQGKLYRDVQHNDGGGTLLDEKKQGVPTEVASPSVDDPLTGNQATQAVQEMAGLGGAGSMYTPVSFEVEILGMPMLDKIDYLGNYVDLTLWNTSFIDDDLKWKREARIPSAARSLIEGFGFPEEELGLYDPRFSQTYQMTGMSHYMTSEGSYSTTLKLVPGEARFDSHLKEKN